MLSLPPANTVPETAGTNVPLGLHDIGWYVRLGAVGSALFLGVGIAWATLAPLEGAVIASGTVAVENNVARIQHPTGGVVGAIKVKEGQHVEFGEVLIRLDETATRTALQIVVNDQKANRARMARLLSERDRLEEVRFSAELTAAAASDTDMRQAMYSEVALFTARERARRGQREQLQQQIEQAREEIIGAIAQDRSAREQLRVAELELSDMRGLLARNLVQRPRVTQLEREVARIGGVTGEIAARQAQLRARISETEVAILQIEYTLQNEVAREIRETETKLNELAQRYAGADDQLRRVDLRSPRGGVVHQLQVHTPGAVVAPGAVVMTIIPERETLVIEARVNPTDIDQIYPDQPARVRFPAFNTRTTPELQGHVFRIAADVSRDERSNQPYYTIGLMISEEQRARLGKLKLIPGMPAEAYIKTTERTVASFLWKPVMEHLNRGFREE